MSQYQAIKAATNAYIKTNGRQEITGAILNAVMIATIDSLGKFYQFVGYATPDTDPGSIDQNVAYLAGTPGTYTHLGGFTLASGEVAVIKFDGQWKKEVVITIPSRLSELINDVGFITNAVSDLVNYYRKSETYTKGEVADILTEYYDKGEVDSIVSTITRQSFLIAWDGTSTPVVSSIPAGVSVIYNGNTYVGTLAPSASTIGRIYLVSNGAGYDEHITTEDGGYSWILIGSTTIDLTGYVTTSQFNPLLSDLGDLRVSDSDDDLDIEDGDGNVLAQFNGGHIKVKNFDSRDVADLSTDDAENADLEFDDPNGNAVVRFVDGHIKTKNFDSSSISSRLPYQRETYFKTKVDCIQMNASSFTATDPNEYVSQVLFQDNCVLLLPDSYTPGGKPTRLIIFCKQGNTQITDSANPILTSNAMGNIFHFLLARGYAILGADGVPDGLSTSLGLDDTRVSGSYAAVQSTREAYDYVIENYNIDTSGAFIFGYSQGGIYAQNVVDLSGIPFLGCAMVSPTLSMRYHLWDLSSSKTIDGVNWTRTSRLNIARLYGFDAVTTNAELLALQFDKEKVAGYDPWNRNVEDAYEGFTQTSAYGSNLWALPSGTPVDSITMKKRIGCPTKIWAAENDSTLGTDVTKVFVKACRNAGQVCDLHLYNSGNHHIFQNTYQNPPISTFDDQGVTYNLYPITYEIASFFYRLGGLSLAD